MRFPDLDTDRKKMLKQLYSIKVNPYKIGVNPFAKEDRLRNLQYALESILFEIGFRSNGSDVISNEKYYKQNNIPIMKWNWNPFVYVDGVKKYYQRPLVWTLEDKQSLIHSIYNNLSCGKIVIRNRSIEEVEAMEKAGETELAFKDCVDGKQRLNAVMSFINNEYQDNLGNYFGDLSDEAQQKFINNQLFSYSEIPENTSDEDVLRQFLKINFTGVPQSKEHISYVESLLRKGI